MFDGLAEAPLTLFVGLFWLLLLGVIIEVTTTTAGVSPGREAEGVMRTMDVCTSVAEGGAEDAVKVDVVTGGRELAAGGAEDCAGGGALDAGGGADDWAGGGFDEGAGDEGGDCDAGGAAEEGGLLEGGGAGEEGAGAAVVSAGGVTDGGRGGEEAAGGAD